MRIAQPFVGVGRLAASGFDFGACTRVVQGTCMVPAQKALIIITSKIYISIASNGHCWPLQRLRSDPGEPTPAPNPTAPPTHTPINPSTHVRAHTYACTNRRPPPTPPPTLPSTPAPAHPRAPFCLPEITCHHAVISCRCFFFLPLLSLHQPVFWCKSFEVLFCVCCVRARWLVRSPPNYSENRAK